MFLSLFEKNKTFILKTKITFSIMNGLSYNNEYYEIFKLNDSTYSKSIKDKKRTRCSLGLGWKGRRIFDEFNEQKISFI